MSTINRTKQAFETAIGAGDAADVGAIYSEQARLLAPSAGIVTGRDAIERFWEAGIGAGIRSARLTTLSVDERDDLAVEVGRYELVITPPDRGSVTDVGKYVVVHRRQGDGSWLWDVDMFNSDGVQS